MPFKRLIDRLKWYLLPGDAYARSLGVTVGSGCRILTRDFGSEPFLVSIGDDVTISSDITFLTHDGATWLVRDGKGRRFLYARIEIGSHVFIGARTVLMPGVTIGDRVVVGAGSVVTKSIPSGSVVAGNPARWIRSFDELETRMAMLPSEADLAGVGGYQARAMAALDETRKPMMTAGGSDDAQS